MSIIEGAQSHYRLFGPYGVFLIARARLSRKPMQIAVTSQRISHPMHLRMRTTDVSLYEEIIVNAEYEFESGREPSVVIDAGANIGLTSVYFANRYPRAKIIAIEPEASNFAMLSKNAERYPNIVPVQAALWKDDAMVNLSDPGSGNWGFQTEERKNGSASGSEVRGVTIDTLMREHGLDRIDILKIDIEGSEKEVFESGRSWIDRVDVLIVELHDRWKSGCSESVRATAKDFSTEWTRGETTFFFRPEHVAGHRETPRTAPSPAGSPAPKAARSRVVAVHC